jgi:hypothetical protein
MEPNIFFHLANDWGQGGQGCDLCQPLSSELPTVQPGSMQMGSFRILPRSSSAPPGLLREPWVWAALSLCSHVPGEPEVLAFVTVQSPAEGKATAPTWTVCLSSGRQIRTLHRLTLLLPSLYCRDLLSCDLPQQLLRPPNGKFLFLGVFTLIRLLLKTLHLP